MLASRPPASRSSAPRGARGAASCGCASPTDRSLRGSSSREDARGAGARRGARRRSRPTRRPRPASRRSSAAWTPARRASTRRSRWSARASADRAVRQPSSPRLATRWRSCASTSSSPGSNARPGGQRAEHLGALAELGLDRRLLARAAARDRVERVRPQEHRHSPARRRRGGPRRGRHLRRRRPGDPAGGRADAAAVRALYAGSFCAHLAELELFPEPPAARGLEPLPHLGVRVGGAGPGAAPGGHRAAPGAGAGAAAGSLRGLAAPRRAAVLEPVRERLYAYPRCASSSTRRAPGTSA